jgi:hypothetical protein
MSTRLPQRTGHWPQPPPDRVQPQYEHDDEQPEHIGSTAAGLDTKNGHTAQSQPAAGANTVHG